MKKILFASLIGVISITSAYAKCDGGTEVTNTAGTTFCKSNRDINWWSAAAWCKENGLHLATMYEMCPNWNGNTGSGKCPELKGIAAASFVWSATASGSNNAFGVHIMEGSVTTYERTTPLYAFCR